MIFLQVKELKNAYTTRVNVQVTSAQQNLNAAQSSLAEINQKVTFRTILHCFLTDCHKNSDIISQIGVLENTCVHRDKNKLW